MKVFGISFVGFLIFFVFIYLIAVGSGAPEFGGMNISPLESGLGVLVAVAAFSFWMTMLVDCFASKTIQNRLVWGLGLIFFSWVAAILYFFIVYLRGHQE